MNAVNDCPYGNARHVSRRELSLPSEADRLNKAAGALVRVRDSHGSIGRTAICAGHPQS